MWGVKSISLSWRINQGMVRRRLVISSNIYELSVKGSVLEIVNLRCRR